MSVQNDFPQLRPANVKAYEHGSTKRRRLMLRPKFI